MDTNFSKIITNGAVINKSLQKKQGKSDEPRQQDNSDTRMSSKTSSAYAAYGLAQVKRFSAATSVAPVEDKPQDNAPKQKSINLFYFSDTHGELSGLTKVGAAKQACEELAGGKDHLTVLGAGDLIAGSQAPVIQATVGVVNQLGMEATSLGNHERGRSNEKLAQLNADMQADILAINATEDDTACAITPSKICKQGDVEFIAIGAQPLSEIQDPKEIAAAIDSEVSRIKEERRKSGLSEDLPVVFLSHMGSDADKVVAENSEFVSVILGGHTHNVEENNYVGKNGQPVHVVQGGKNNELATVVRIDIAEDGTVSASSKKIDLKTDEKGICSQVEEFYGDTSKSEEVLTAALEAEKTVAETVEESVGPKVEIASVPEGYGYKVQAEPNGQIRERNYSNPVANIMADAMLEAGSKQGAQIAFFNAPSVKDTEIPDGSISNYDIISRMLPFGGEVVVADVPIAKLYDIIEEQAQGVATDDSQLVQVAGMVYTVDAEKAQARNQGRIAVLKAEDDLKKAKAAGASTAKEEAALAEAKAHYDELPRCVEKILIMQEYGKQIKINPFAIERGDYDGQTVKCATNDYFAHVTGLSASPVGESLSEVFEKQLETVRNLNDGELFVDQNDVRISTKDPNGIINGYAPQRSVSTKHWH